MNNCIAQFIKDPKRNFGSSWIPAFKEVVLFGKRSVKAEGGGGWPERRSPLKVPIFWKRLASPHRLIRRVKTIFQGVNLFSLSLL